MPFYLTRDPVPSADMRNVFDNAQNLDLALNDITSSFWSDRLGRSRMSWFGLESAFTVKLSDFESRFSTQIVEQETTFDASQADKENRFQAFLDSSGYVFLGDYEDGPFQFSARNQYIRYNNQYYRLNAATDVGFTTTGTDATSFVNDVTHFVLMDGDTLRQNLGSEEEGMGGGLISTNINAEYPDRTVGWKLNKWVLVEEFADANSAADDWTTALKNALIFAVNNNIRDVYAGDLTLGDTVKLDASTFSNIHLHARSVKPGANWPANSTLWDAKSMFQLGASSGQVVSFVLDIEKIDGGGIANYVEPVGNGMAYGKIKFGLITKCVRPFAMGKQTWPNASVMVEGDDLAYNWVGGHIERGTSGTTPISEGWNFSVRFNHGNRYGGWLIRNGGQYAKFGFGDMDYNGGWLSVLQVSTLSGISRGASVSNGTTTCEVLCYYTHQGANYVALMENRSVAGGNSSYSVGDTISGAGYTGTVTGVTTAATNSSGNNYFDLIHDFQGSAFGKVSVFGGYCGGVIGGSQFSSDLMFHNSFDGRALNLRGLGVSESGTILSLYRKAESNTAVVNITDDYFNISKRLFMRYRMIEGTPVATTLPKSPAAFKTVYTFSDSATDKYLAEGSMYEVTVKGNYPDAWARFVIFVMGNSIRMVSDDHDTDVFAWQFSGLSLQMRQNAQDVIQIAINIRRV
ncbi:TPA: hypothetical protein ACTXAA_004577 [Raoultella planticola]|uniref:hypothetical protein n=1 Tax=Klebsiella michiganensis TaxID=1134687 RepID=UPI00191FC5C6|nr:hypothetical protein [Klebsiella michiganensis]MBL0775503.1 hypothetical protein [Klebsiella michiganensis]